MNLSFDVPYPVMKIGEDPFETVLPVQRIDRDDVLPQPELQENEPVFANLDQEQPNEPDEEIDFDGQIQQKAQELLADTLAAPMQALQNVLNSMQEKSENDMIELQYAAIKLAHAIAKKIVYKTIEESSDVILNQVQDVLKHCKDHQASTLILNPEDHDFIQENTEFLLKMQESAPGLRIASDEHIQRGGCKLESEFSIMDATIESQLARIEKELLL
ncbi:MAG: hypothetical protein DWQ05_14000 [Calditrichaeota bacterium]|nr:MAG: hypothetical protein DWQ05_14000 [Calditrichota bacterium]